MPSLPVLGTIPQWGTLFAILGGALIWWIKTAAERGRVTNERLALTTTAEANLRDEYAVQLRDFRDEVRKYRNELQAVQGELMVSDRLSSQRSGWNTDMMFIIELLVSELERLDPTSKAVKQAKAMLKRMAGEGNDPAKSDALNTAETAVVDAKQALRSTQHTVLEINADEATAAKGEGK